MVMTKKLPIGLDPKACEGWNELTDWLDTVETDFTWSKEDPLNNFERFIGRDISWSKK